jgi:hypothetical protein
MAWPKVPFVAEVVGSGHGEDRLVALDDHAAVAPVLVEAAVDHIVQGEHAAGRDGGGEGGDGAGGILPVELCR